MRSGGTRPPDPFTEQDAGHWAGQGRGRM